MKTLIAAAVAVAASAASASAQTRMTFGSSQPSAFGADPIMPVTSTFRTSVAVTEPQAVPNPSAQETARRALYTMAEGECAALSQIFKAECRLSQRIHSAYSRVLHCRSSEHDERSCDL